MDDNDTDPAGRWAGPVGRGMMTAEQLEKEWMAQDKILDFRNWLVAQLIESRGKVATLLIIARNDAYAAAPLAEKERKILALSQSEEKMKREE